MSETEANCVTFEANAKLRSNLPHFKICAYPRWACSYSYRDTYDKMDGKTEVNSEKKCEGKVIGKSVT